MCQGVFPELSSPFRHLLPDAFDPLLCLFKRRQFGCGIRLFSLYFTHDASPPLFAGEGRQHTNKIFGNVW
jgi:hypothetical protein